MHRRLPLFLAPVIAAAALSSPATAQTSLTTLFATNNGGGAGWTTYFDLTVQVPLAITSLDINAITAGVTGSVDIYATASGGTHVGNEFNPVWTLLGSSSQVVSSTTNFPTTCPLTSPLVLPPGTYGIGIHHVGLSPAYTNGTGANQTYSSGEMTLSAGSSSALAPGQTAQLFTPRVWNGTIHYTITSGAGFGSAATVGAGCGGSGPETFYEVFTTPGSFDLTTGFAILPGGAEDLVIPSFSPLVTPSGAPLAMSDDFTTPVNLPWPFPSRLGPLQSVWLCSNGWLAFEATTLTDYTESTAELLSGPARLCAMWDDLNPSAGGTVHAELDPNAANLFHITFTAVPEFGSSAGANTFQYSFDAAGTIEVKYGAASVQDCLVGLSYGHGAAAVTASDLSDPGLFLTVGDGNLPLELRGGMRPVLGRTASLTTDEMPAGATGAALLLGYAGYDPGIDLSGLGMTGCALYTTGEFPVPFPAVGSSQTVMFPIGFDTRLVGAQIHIQSAVIVPGRNPAGLVLSNGIVWTLDQN